MFEIVEAIHKALRTQSTLVFVLVVAAVFATLGGGIAWLVDLGYKNALAEKFDESKPESPKPTSVSPQQPRTPPQSAVSLSEEAKQQIVQKLAQEYKELHPEAKRYSQPTVNWINKKLKQQKLGFFVSLKPQKSRGIVVEGGGNNVIENNVIEGFDEGISIHNSPGTTAEGNKVTGPKQPQ